MYSLIRVLCALVWILASTVVSQTCPSDYDFHPVLLISMDGFRYDYLDRGLNPNIAAFRDQGVTTPYMVAAFPTITFPNHYTIVTGLYPESHGIVGNHFYDRDFDQSFDLGDPATVNGSWWGGDPVWNTVQNQGVDRKSAAMFWPGSDADIDGMYPTYYYPYDGSVPYADRVQQVLDWLAMDVTTRPDFISLYFDEPDHTAHSYGPDTPEVDVMLQYMDLVIKNLTDGIASMGLTDCVNIILLADHGQATAGSSRVINLATYDPEIADEGFVEYGPFAMVYVYDEDDTASMRTQFSCQQPELRQFTSNSMPTRNHFSNNIRIGDVLLDTTDGYSVDVGEPGETGETLWYLEGQHGNDPFYATMQPIFIAKGPEFLSGVQIEPFQNIEIYELMCTMLGITPSPNNGTAGSLFHTLKSPPAYPTTPIQQAPPSSVFPDEATLQSRLSLSGCPGDYGSPPNWIYNLNMTVAETATSETQHLPWGIPYSDGLQADVMLLHHFDHILGYSNLLKMPLWTSFTIAEHSDGGPVLPWSSDVRLDSSSTSTCELYNDVVGRSVYMGPLFPRRYSVDNSQAGEVYLTSNALPMTTESIIHFTELIYTYLPIWVDQSVSPLNVVIGPAFDKNFDSLVDNYTMFETDELAIPSHMFAVVTRCLQNVTSLNACSATSLDTMAFILPQRNFILNCMSADNFALEFSAKVKDVEIITGLMFYPSLSYKDRTRLELRIHSTLWLPSEENEL